MSALNLCFFGLEIQMIVFIRNYNCAPLSLILTRSPFNLGASWSTMSRPRSRRTPTEYSNARSPPTSRTRHPLRLPCETCDTSGGTTLETMCIADLKTKVVAPDKVCAQMSSPQHLVPAEKRENF
jgi:hypothetical protein